MREQQRKHTISIKKKEKEAREAKEMAEAEALAETILKSVEVGLLLPFRKLFYLKSVEVVFGYKILLSLPFLFSSLPSPSLFS